MAINGPGITAVGGTTLTTAYAVTEEALPKDFTEVVLFTGELLGQPYNFTTGNAVWLTLAAITIVGFVWGFFSRRPRKRRKP